MPQPKDMEEPSVYTEEERLANRRQDAGIAFELNHPPLSRQQFVHHYYGHLDD